MKHKDCWKANSTEQTPETMNRAMIAPLRHAYTVPPKLMAMTRQVKEATLSKAPT